MGAHQPHTQVDTCSIPMTDMHTWLPLTRGISAASVLLTHPEVSPPRGRTRASGDKKREEWGCLMMFGAMTMLCAVITALSYFSFTFLLFNYS